MKNLNQNANASQEEKFFPVLETIFEGTIKEDEIEIPIDKRWVNQIKRRKKS